MAKNKQTQNSNTSNDCWDAASTQTKNSSTQSKNKNSNKAGMDKYGAEDSNTPLFCS